MSEKVQVLKGKKVLVVDDSSEQRGIVAELYRDLGCEIVGEAEDGLEALSKLSDLQPEIVSLDIIMPNMDGVECYTKLKEDYPDIKVLFVSCLVRNTEVRDILTNKIEASLLLPKPCEKEVLMAALLKLYGIKEEPVATPPEASSKAGEAESTVS